jgi:hypothetical protein
MESGIKRLRIVQLGRFWGGITISSFFVVFCSEGGRIAVDGRPNSFIAVRGSFLACIPLPVVHVGDRNRLHQEEQGINVQNVQAHAYAPNETK